MINGGDSTSTSTMLGGGGDGGGHSSPVLIRRVLFLAIVATFACVFPTFLLLGQQGGGRGSGDGVHLQEDQALAFLQNSNRKTLNAVAAAAAGRREEETGTATATTATTSGTANAFGDGILQKPRVNLNLVVPATARDPPTTTASSSSAEAVEKTSSHPKRTEVKASLKLVDEISSKKKNQKKQKGNDDGEGKVTDTSATASTAAKEAGPSTTSKTGSGSSSNSNCLKPNSGSWLEGPRHGNGNDALMDATFVKRMTLNLSSLLLNDASSQFALGQSICPAPSRFRNASDVRGVDDADSDALYHWRIRLVYLASVYHQQQPALQEAQARYAVDDGTCQHELKRKGIGPYDFECLGAKFLVVSLAGVGLGINIRGGAVRAMLAGLASQRVVLIVSNAHSGPGDLPKPWRQASCERSDYSCFFMPPTPCVLTHADLQNAYSLEKSEIRKLVKKGQLPDDQKKNDAKVWYMPLGFSPQEIPQAAKEMLHRHATTLIGALPNTDPRLTALKLGAASILEPDKSEALPIALSLAIFFLRPNPHYAQKVDEIFGDISGGVDPERSIGLPIRASDKCGHESECLSFVNHMEALADLRKSDARFRFGQRNFSAAALDTTIVFTTESKVMVKEQEDFAANETAVRAVPFSFRIATNTHDVHPDTGAALNRRQQEDLTPDEVMLSAVSTLKFQLLPAVSVGNCCSNFHIMLLQLLAAGCGAASTNHFHCMQNNENPNLRMCCAWKKDCIEEKRLAIEQYNSNNNKTTVNSNTTGTETTTAAITAPATNSTSKVSASASLETSKHPAANATRIHDASANSTETQ